MPSYNSYDIKIPHIIVGSNKEIIREYLRSFYDDEGCASLRLNKNTKEWKRNINLSSNSLKILKQIKQLLAKFDIKTNKISRNHTNSNYDKSFVLGITGKENFILFQKMIGFKHPRKIKMLNSIIESYNATSKNKEAFLQLKEQISGF